VSKKLVCFFDKYPVTNPYQSIDDKIIRSINARRSASVFSAKDFQGFGKGLAIGQALARLAKAGKLRRIRQGFYDLPRPHPLLGQTSPDPTAVVQALMKGTEAQWQFSGAYAANQLGLSEQVPAKILVLTDGTPRRVALGRLTLVFRHAAPRNLLGAGRPAGLVIQALRHLRKTGLSAADVARLNQKLDAATKVDLAKLAPNLPAWMQPLVNRIDASLFRERLFEVETQVHGSQPLLVFDNHDQVRSWDRYGDGVHNEQIAKIVAALLLTSRATALMYQGEELGLSTTIPTRVEEVRDPIGITGWPKEKGRDGERTPMQWDDSNAQAGFSTNPKTWLPVSKTYKAVNVKKELADPESLLNWYKQLIALRRNNPALHNGRMVFLDRLNPNVLSYLRIDETGKAVLVSLNMTGTPQLVSLHLSDAGVNVTIVKTLMTSDDSLWSTRSMDHLKLAPFSSWVASVE
jgi:hypothetical protein